MAEGSGEYDWDRHGEEHEKIWRSIDALREQSLNSLNAATEFHLSLETIRDSVARMTGSVESLVEAVRNDVTESKALRMRLEQQEESAKRLEAEAVQRHADLLAELRLAKADSRDLMTIIRKLLDRIPPENLS